jgi:hypothetical protein
MYGQNAFAIDAFLLEAFPCRELTPEDKKAFQDDDRQDQLNAEKRKVKNV